MLKASLFGHLKVQLLKLKPKRLLPPKNKKDNNLKNKYQLLKSTKSHYL
jgi:hypothetical protein